MRLNFKASLVAIGVFALADSRAPASTPRAFDFGPIASRYKDIHGEWHTTGLGPFFETASSTQDMHFTAVRPFHSRIDDPPRERIARDYLWPLATTRDLKCEQNSRFLIFFNFNHDTRSINPRYRWWIIPFYFHGRDINGNTYRALFPLGGTIREFLGRDEIKFWLFPIRSTSRLNDLKTSNWLWPIYSETKGDDTYRFRVFPFYLYSHREGNFTKKAILWPFWNSAEYYHPKSSGKGHILFPVYGHMKLTDQETWWVIPPFFRYTTGDQTKMLFAPWPFVQWRKSMSTNDSYEKLYIWPLYGRKQIDKLQQSFALWPFFHWSTFDRDTEVQDRFSAVPFYFGETVTKKAVSNEPEAVVKRSSKLWPLYSYRRKDDESRFKMLELWPFAEASAVERNWAPFWTLYSRKTKGDNVDIEILWGLYRQQHREGGADYYSLFPLFDWRDAAEAAPAGSRWSILKGLIGYEHADSRKRLRMLYFFTLPLGRETKP